MPEHGVLVWLLRIYRILLLCGIAWCLRSHMREIRSTQSPLATPAEVAIHFPTATTSKTETTTSGSIQIIYGTDGKELGSVVLTSPQTDHLIGYAGPNRLLIARDLEHKIMGISLLNSGDTQEHVAMIRQSNTFFQQWQGWNPDVGNAPEIDAVSGSTLTSLAIAEAIQQRLTGSQFSLRFPSAITAEEMKLHFPTAARMEAAGNRFHVYDKNDHLLGQLLRTSPAADNVAGYAGPTECLISLAPEQDLILRITIRKSYDTESYVEQVQSDRHYLKTFNGRSFATLAGLDYEKEGIEGVSGSTDTSYAIAESLKRRAQLVEAKPTASPAPSWNWTWQDGIIAALVLGSLGLSFSKWRGKTWVRTLWQGLLVILLGILTGQMLSLGQLTGWALHGLPLQFASGFMLLAAVALLIPWATRRQLYCHHLCPHGAAQTLIGKLNRKPKTLPKRWHQWLSRLPGLLLVIALMVIWFAPGTDLSKWEAFDAWLWQATAWVSISIAVIGLIISYFIPQAYCHYGCPTGALLRFARSSGQGDKLRWSDWVATGLFLVALTQLEIRFLF